MRRVRISSVELFEKVLAGVYPRDSGRFCGVPAKSFSNATIMKGETMNKSALILIDFINEIVDEKGKFAGKGYPAFVKAHGVL